MKSCIIADDHPLMREALSAMVSHSWLDAQVTEVRDYAELMAAVGTSTFDICLADLSMPGPEPLKAMADLKALAPALPVLVITGSADDNQMLALIALGVAGFIGKSTDSAVLEAAIRLVLAGGRYIPERIADMQVVPQTDRSLSPRQIDVLRLVSGGLTNKEIARDLGIAPSSVKTHLEAACLALSVASRTEAALAARQRGLIVSQCVV